MALVEILVTPDCPYERAAVTRVAVAAQVLEMRPEVRLITIRGLDEARSHAFFGSPTIRIDGADISAVPSDDDPSLRCRLYETAHGLDWVPDVRPICRALDKAARRERLPSQNRPACAELRRHSV